MLVCQECGKGVDTIALGFVNKDNKACKKQEAVREVNLGPACPNCVGQVVDRAYRWPKTYLGAQEL